MEYLLGAIGLVGLYIVYRWWTRNEIVVYKFTKTRQLLRKFGKRTDDDTVRQGKTDYQHTPEQIFLQPLAFLRR